MQESFSSIEMGMRIKRDSALMKAHALIDWERLRPLLSGLYKREASRAGGQEPFDALLMFKATLLGQWHSLSDPKLEAALTIRIDFMHFCGLTMLAAVPDESTLCRFRNRLIDAGKLAPLLAAVNAQLQGHGLMVAHAKGAVIDATLITAAARPHSKTIIEHETNNDNDNDGDGDGNSSSDTDAPTANQAEQADHAATAATNAIDTNSTTADATEPVAPVAPVAVAPIVTKTASVDPDATWVKKGAKSHFGFRTYTTVDAGDGYIRGVHTAPANEGECPHFKAAIASADFKPERAYADKGFASKANRQHLTDLGIKSAIMHKADRNKPLNQRKKNLNKAISKTRYIVEQCFGTMKRLFGMSRASYMGTVKVNAQFTIKAMCMNLLKAANKICLLPIGAGDVRPERVG